MSEESGQPQKKPTVTFHVSENAHLLSALPQCLFRDKIGFAAVFRPENLFLGFFLRDRFMGRLTTGDS
jgi:hypothetical protein